HWVSCNAGQNTMGIESDGTIKGCPSLPTSPYSGGNVRDLSVKDIWQRAPELSFTRKRTVDDLWGFCRTCYYADVCRAGCSWTTHVLFGKPGNNPYCHHRTLELEKRGLRERIVRVEAAPGTPFDYGLFELVLEHSDGSPYLPQGDVEQPRTQLAITNRPAPNLVQLSSKLTAKPKKREPKKREPKAKFAATPTMALCRGCNQYVARRTEVCPHCQGDVKALARQYEKKLRAAQRASDRLMELLQF
ncbi:MAG TPA: SPASM domain-containing protein, partial [Blastocatellia bacterium]|nr:SPASM domain-containing protein [Blastocatellia bacterium]